MAFLLNEGRPFMGESFERSYGGHNNLAFSELEKVLF